jgi:histidinol phosphatase-like PHP family hydrolase
MITANWHQHSHHSVECHGNGHTLSRLALDNMAAGFTAFGVTDHIHTPVNRPDLEACRAEFQSEPRPAGFHFAVEVSVVSRWELDELAAGRGGAPGYGLRQGGPPGAEPALALTAEDVAVFGFAYVVGGAHWPLYVPLEREAVIRDYHRQNLFLATHPLVTIVAHPWWWMGHWQDADGMYRGDPWLDDFRKVPVSMHDEFAAAAIANGKRVEVNGLAMLLNPGYPERFKAQYLERLADWKAQGVRLSFGSDDHGQPGHRVGPREMEQVERMLAAVGIGNDDLWAGPEVDP